MVLSRSRAQLDLALDRLAGAGAGKPAGSRAGGFAEAVAGLGEVDAAAVDLLGNLCARLAPSDPALAPVASTLHPWTALAAGWRTDAEGVAARFSLAYDDPATAAGDIAGRARLAREGSTADGRPLADVAFRLVDARAEGAVQVLDVEPAGGMPKRILQAFLRGDLPFAGCG